ncbi:MAG: extracellular solute-binding protein [Limnochordales bacterium]|nr:extracellular solute-binding protein [Limnochordales bacterium]
MLSAKRARTPAIALILAVTLAATVPKPGTIAHAATSSTPVTIRYMFWGGESEQQKVEQLIKMFRASNPDIQVIPEHTPYPEYGDKVPILLASGAGPDVIMLPPYLVPALAAAGALAALDPFLAQDRSFTLDDFVGPARDIFRFGSLYALPREFGPYALFYNRSMFEAKGLAEPDWSWDWQALVSAGRKLTADVDGRREHGHVWIRWGGLDKPLPAVYLAGGWRCDRPQQHHKRRYPEGNHR